MKEQTKYNITDKAAHHLASLNRTGIEASGICGCFCCCQLFPATEVIKYVGLHERALCPYCKIDSVLPDYWIELSADLLYEMRQRWFGNGQAVKVPKSEPRDA